MTLRLRQPLLEIDLRSITVRPVAQALVIVDLRSIDRSGNDSPVVFYRRPTQTNNKRSKDK